LQPHTLNNILANLKSIANKLNKGMDSLSDTLDYILYKGNTHMVSVKDELEFIRKYLVLNDLFTSEIDSIKLDLAKVNKNSNKFSTNCIPHLITAYLVENAFKHGDVNHPEFLKINIILTDDLFEMIVINRLKQKPNEKKGGIGLDNMRKRLELLLPGKFNIKTSCNEFEYISSLIINF
jgi:LytS/YehU family sensor histidine kinase